MDNSNQSVRVLLFANGKPPKKAPKIEELDYVVSIDGAYNYLKKIKIKPHLICGDLDSIVKPPKQIQKLHFPDQGYTDFEKTLEHLEKKGYYQVHVYGATQKNHDHFLGNLHTARRFRKRLQITFFDDEQYFFFANKQMKIKIKPHKIISLFPFPKAEKVSIEGFKYPLRNKTLSIGKNIGTRNESLEKEISISFKKGHLIVFVGL